MLLVIISLVLSEILISPALTAPTLGSPNVAIVIIIIIMFITGNILVIISWIGTLIKTAQFIRWGWFVCLLIFGPLAMFAYVFVGPTTRAAQLQQPH